MNSELQEKLQKLLNLRDKLEKRIDELKNSRKNTRIYAAY